MQERQLVERVWEFCCSVLRRAFKPFDALSGTLGEAKFAVEFYYAETIHGTWVECGGGFAKELERFGRFTSAAPAVLATRASPISCVRMAMLCSKYEQWIGTIKVLLALVCADPVGVAVCEKVLTGRMATVGETLEESERLCDEVVSLFDRLFNVHDVAWGRLRYGVCL